MSDIWPQGWSTFLGALLSLVIFEEIRWLIDVLPDLFDWLADWRVERRNRKAIRQLWRTYGRKPPYDLRRKHQTWALWYGGDRAAKSTHQWKRPK